MSDIYCETESENRVRLTCAFDLEPREVEWLWVGRVPLGMITMFAGDPKLGKSFVTLAMAAAGFSRDQTRRAKHRIGAVARREGFGVNGGWIWKLGAQVITR
jgi:AAA domain